MTTVFLPFLILLLVGTLWGYIPSVPDRQTVRSALSAVVLNVFLPALTLQVLYHAPLNRELWAVPVVSIVTCLLSLAAALAAFRVIEKVTGHRPPRTAEGSLLLAAAWCNATYLGLPVITALSGAEYQRIPILFDLLAITPLLLTLGVAIGMGHGSSTNRRNLRAERGFVPVIFNGLGAVLSLPALWAGAIGLALNVVQLPIPTVIIKACELAGSAVAPMMIFAVGLALRISSFKRIFWLTPSLLIKLLLAPILAYGLVRLVGLSGEVAHATVMEAAMPTMVLTMVICDRCGLDSELLAQAIAVSTGLSFLTIPALYHYLG